MNTPALPAGLMAADPPAFVARYRRRCPRTGETVPTTALIFLPDGAQADAERLLAPFIRAGMVERLEGGRA